MKLRKTPTPFIQSLATLPVDANDITVIETTRGFREKILELIKSARNRIYITALYLQDDESGREVLQAIYQAKQENPQIDVKVFVDFLRAQRGLMGQPQSIGNVRLYRELAEQYEHPIEILGVPVKSREVLGVLHLKGFVFDDTLLYSGASINNVYLQQNERYRYDRYQLIRNKSLCDCMVRFLQDNFVNSSAVKSLTQEAIPEKKQLRIPIKQLKKELSSCDYQFQAKESSEPDNQVLVTPLLGFGIRKNALNRVIFEMIKNTQEYLTIYTPYFNLPSLLHRAVRKILRKGKIVNIVVGDKTANDFFIPVDQPFNRIGIVPYVYETNLRAFVKKNQKFIDNGQLNVCLWRHEDNSFHLKGLSSDDNQYLITGHNLNPRACRLDLENGILVQDPHHLLKDKFQQEQRLILTHTQRVKHFSEIEMIKDYPEAARKLMRSVKRTQLDRILNRLL